MYEANSIEYKTIVSFLIFNSNVAGPIINIYYIIYQNIPFTGSILEPEVT